MNSRLSPRLWKNSSSVVSSTPNPRWQPISSRCLSSTAITSESIAHPSNKIQVYSSTSSDTIRNLSFEHALLSKSHPESTILFLYVNRPSVVIGRNQNPWLEVNMDLLSQRRDAASNISPGDQSPRLVRRRSGGGTVFHDYGNVNFSVICPSAAFDRDRHAEMVVRALRRLGCHSARVNERHDIVMDASQQLTASDQVTTATRKVSGSAYKLTRQRALHHGTCLLRSPNISRISALLKSPAAPYITALGSPSVRSPVANVGLDNDLFINEATEEFCRMYGQADIAGVLNDSDNALATPGISPDLMHDITAGEKELRSDEWTYGQTPKFTFSMSSADVETQLGGSKPTSTSLLFSARHGIINDIRAESIFGESDRKSQSDLLGLTGAKLWEIPSWTNVLRGLSPSTHEWDSLGSVLDSYFKPYQSRLNSQ